MSDPEEKPPARLQRLVPRIAEIGPQFRNQVDMRRRQGRDLPKSQIPPIFWLIMTKKDIYDGEPWSEVAIANLRQVLRHDHTIEEAAGYLCRSGTVDDVRRKAKELGLIHD